MKARLKSQFENKTTIVINGHDEGHGDSGALVIAEALRDNSTLTYINRTDLLLLCTPHN